MTTEKERVTELYLILNEINGLIKAKNGNSFIMTALDAGLLALFKTHEETINEVVEENQHAIKRQEDAPISKLKHCSCGHRPDLYEVTCYHYGIWKAECPHCGNKISSEYMWDTIKFWNDNIDRLKDEKLCQA